MAPSSNVDTPHDVQVLPTHSDGAQDVPAAAASAAETGTGSEPESEAELNLENEGGAENVADAADTGEGSKLKMIVSLLKRCLGVKDLAAMCVSLRFLFFSFLLLFFSFLVMNEKERKSMFSELCVYIHVLNRTYGVCF